MANKEKLESVKFEDLAEGTWYTVKKSGFNIVESKKNKGTKFVSYWFVITNGTDTKITSVTGSKADKAMAITFNCKISVEGKNGLNIKSIRRTVRNGYDDIQYIVEPWVVKEDSKKSEEMPF